jgi:hypothetical protein
VIAGLFSLLNFLVADPMTSMSNPTGGAAMYKIPSDQFDIPKDNYTPKDTKFF